MASFAGRISRRSVLFSGLSAARLLAQKNKEPEKGPTFPSDLRQYSDPSTELTVYRFTDPAYTSTLPAPYGRAISRNSAWMLFACDRTGAPQAFYIDLKNGETRQLTEVEALDPVSLTLTPDNRSFCYFAGRSLWLANVNTLHARELYQVPAGWERVPGGVAVEADGTHAVFAEQRAGGSRIRLVALSHGAVQTVIEPPFAASHPIPRPVHAAQILYRQGDEALWLVDTDGRQNRRLQTADGRVGQADWSPDGRTVLYLNFPSDSTQLNAIREIAPEQNTEKLVAKTSQFVSFGFNRDTSVFVGASRNRGSPVVLLLLRMTRREFTLCEHKSARPVEVAPRFSPDSQRVYFVSDRHGKPAIYGMHVEKLVERTDA